MKQIRIIEDDTAIRTELTKNEARILWCLMQKEVCTRDELIYALYFAMTCRIDRGIEPCYTDHINEFGQKGWNGCQRVIPIRSGRISENA